MKCKVVLVKRSKRSCFFHILFTTSKENESSAAPLETGLGTLDIRRLNLSVRSGKQLAKICTIYMYFVCHAAVYGLTIS